MERAVRRGFVTYKQHASLGYTLAISRTLVLVGAKTHCSASRVAAELLQARARAARTIRCRGSNSDPTRPSRAPRAIIATGKIFYSINV